MNHSTTQPTSPSDNQQLRSPRARRFLGQPAPKCMLAGTTLVALLVMALLLALRMTHYPTDTSTNAEQVPPPTLWELLFHRQ